MKGVPIMEKLREIKLESETIFNGKIVKLTKDKVKCPNGRESTREVINHCGAACVVAVDNGKNVVLYQQAKTLLGIAMCLVFLDDSVDALKVFDELESLTPSFLTPRKDELKRLQKLGREFKAECFD